METVIEESVEGDFEGSPAVLEHAVPGVPVDWVQLTVPAEDAARLQLLEVPRRFEFVAEDGARMPVVVGARVGNHGVRTYVLAQFARPLVRGCIREATAARPPLPFVLHPAVAIANPVRVVADAPLAWHTESACAAFVEEVAEMRIGSAVLGIRRRTWSMHPVVDYWIAPTRFGDGSFDGDHFDEQLDFGPMADVHVHALSQFAEVEVTQGRLRLSLDLDQFTAPPLMVRVAYHHPDGDDALSAALVASAAHPRPQGLAEWDSGRYRWMTLGVLPHRGAGSPTVMDYPSIVARLGRDRPSIYLPRFGDQAMSTNQSGTQRFGCSLSDWIVSLGPQQAYGLLRHMAEGEALRPVHWRDQQGRAFRAAEHPGMRALNRRIHERNTKDMLGLDELPPRVTEYSKRTADDQQHTDDLGLDAFEGLFDDGDVRATRAAIIEIELCEDRLLRGHVNTAARGIGRPAVALANTAWLHAGTELGDKAAAVCAGMVPATLNDWDGKEVLERFPDRPIRPLCTLDGDPRVQLYHPDTGAPLPTAMPYEHAIAALGFTAIAQVVHGATRGLALQLALAAATDCALWCYRDQSGSYMAPYAVAVQVGDELGLPLPAEWCEPGTPAFAATHMANDSWWTWTVGGILLLPYLEDVLHVPVPRALEQLVAQACAFRNGGVSDLAARFSATPMSIEQAPLLPAPVREEVAAGAGL